MVAEQQMEPTTQTRTTKITQPDFQQAWEMVLGQLRGEMSRATLETWVQPLQPIGYQGQTFTLGAYNSYAREWVENRLHGRITQLLEGLFNEPVKLRLVVVNGFVQKQSVAPKDKPANNKKPAPVHDEPIEDESGPSTSRKMMLQRAYGSERAKLIQPERGMFVTLYFFYEWLPLLGHSAFATILAARSLCYWNPMTGELRNTIETEMSELASRAAVSVRTVKDVLTNALVQKYFLRYRVRRVMTPNGVRTAGISLQVRMDDPLTPQDQELSGFTENEQWYSPEFEHEDEES
jgi:hypothetical protein